MQQQTLTADYINQRILNDNKAVEWALRVLYARQTTAEQASDITTEANGRGFNSRDADIFSSFARWVERGRSLSNKQLAICRATSKSGVARLARYHRQLIEEIEARKQKQAAPGAINVVRAPQPAQNAPLAAREVEEEAAMLLSKLGFQRRERPVMAAAEEW